MANIYDTIRLVKNIFDVVQNIDPPEEKLVEVPVLYGGNYGKDIQRVVQFSKLSEGEIIQRHQNRNYLVYFLGFSPGFPYLGGMDQDLTRHEYKHRENVFLKDLWQLQEDKRVYTHSLLLEVGI